ncbi:MAG: hypothetical protein ACXW6J_21280 [Candidatus Binatia bacterium]
MRRFLAGVSGLLSVISAASLATAQTSFNYVILGHSGGAGSLGNLRRIIKRDKLWDMAGGNIAGDQRGVISCAV